MKLKTLLAASLLMLSACSGPKVDDYAGRTPELDLRDYLNDKVEAWGVIMDSSGMVTDQFHVVLNCSWQGNDGKLVEHFNYTDGRTDDRTWTVHYNDDHHFTATAHDVVGEAKGGQFGNAVNMRYTLRVPLKDGSIDLAMNDWMYRMDDKTLINHTEMHKLGFKVGELFLTFRKKS